MEQLVTLAVFTTMTQTRDSHGRFKADHRTRNIAIGTATAVGAVASAVGAALHFGLFDRWLHRGEGHEAPDLAPGAQDYERAPDAFRPEGDAPVGATEREALRPATHPVPQSTDRRSEPAAIAELASAHPS